MNNKDIAKHLKEVVDTYINGLILPTESKDILVRDTIITGGSIVSLLLGETPNDYDLYFKTDEAINTVTNYHIQANDIICRTPNAITLENKIQLITKVHGTLDVIHQSFDFAHTKCSYDVYGNYVTLPSRCLEAIINKELIYEGSKYPVSSMFRVQKFTKLGWSINKLQMFKIMLQLSKLDLTSEKVLMEQLNGVSESYIELLDALDFSERTT